MFHATGNDGLINVWNYENHDLLHSIKMADKAVTTTSLVLMKDDRHAAGSADSKVGVWDLDTGEAICRVDNEDVVNCIAISRDDKTIITGGANNMIKVWDVSTGELLHTLSGHKGRWSSKVSTAISFYCHFVILFLCRQQFRCCRVLTYTGGFV